MKKQLLLLLPLALISLILYVSATGQMIENIQHLFFISFTTFIIYAYQVYLNSNFKLTNKLIWWIFLFFIPSVAATVYWFRYISKNPN